MTDTTITFRTDQKLKNEATEVFENVGMNLSSAINMFLKQAVIKKTFPCAIEAPIADEYNINYRNELFKLFGCGNNLGLDSEPSELSYDGDRRENI